MKSGKINNVLKKVIPAAVVTVIVGGFIFMWSFAGTHEAIMTSAGNLPTTQDKQTIILDAGHGGIDGGCVSVNGISEKGINLSIVESERDLLRVMGYDVVCTREEDKAIYDRGIEGLSNQKKSDMQNRLKIFSKYPEGISLSIHQNQFTDSKYSGAQMFYSEKNSDGERLASSMQKQFVSMLQPQNTRETKPVGDELYLLNNTENAAIMIECGFLSNPEEAALLESESYQKQVAFTIMTGIFEYCDSTK